MYAARAEFNELFYNLSPNDATPSGLIIYVGYIVAILCEYVGGIVRLRLGFRWYCGDMMEYAYVGSSLGCARIHLFVRSVIP